ncbi:MAG TPA: hypothetical protein VI039_01870 [Solirubrobacterales bacterium]
MGRAPRTLLLVLFVACLQPATALGVDGDGEITFAAPLQANHGLSAKLEADEDEIELTVRKRGQQAVYFAQGEVSSEGITASFGPFGEFAVDYQPFRTLQTREPGRRCEGEPITTTEGFFRGTLRFRGEGDYVRIEAARVKGTLVLSPPWRCQYGRAGVSRVGERAADDKATLVAFSRRKPTIRFAAFGSREEGEKPFTAFFAVSQEVREGIGISRFTSTGTRSAGFEFDNRRGTALVDPPAPFAGSARYLRLPHARDSWRGTLTAPLLGLGRVRLAGPGFNARMVPRLPYFR